MDKKRMLIVALTGVIVAYLYNQLKISAKSPIVQTSYGKVVGSIDFSRTGKEFYQYLGIPYALPPIGERRFEPPAPPSSWEGVKEATSHGSTCLQLNLLSSKVRGSEDCLFLNVFAPKEKKTNGLPVIIFIHGGAFISGGSNIYGANYFMDEQVILVTLNYRLAALGFLNTGDSVVRGNMGLKDQLMALRWVNANIKSFGGDPNRVTLFGESAGAVSANYHILSPQSKGLFTKAIAQSGTSLSYWALYPHPKQQSKRYAAKFGCPVEDSKEMVACLKKIDAEVFVNGHKEMQDTVRDSITAFVPTLETFVDENTFLSEHPRVLLEEGRFYKVPMIAGVNSEEGLFLSAILTVNETKMIDASERWTSWISKAMDVPEDEKLAKSIRKFYFGDNKNLVNQSLLANYTNMISDRVFFVPLHQHAKLYCDHAPIRLYYYTHKGDFSLGYLTAATAGRFPYTINVIVDCFSRWLRRTLFNEDTSHMGAAHADELPLFFHLNLGFGINFGLNLVITTSHRDFEMSANMVKAWVSFASNDATEDMTYADLKWLPVNSMDSKITYLQIDNQPQFVVDPIKERVDFWESLAIPKK